MNVKTGLITLATVLVGGVIVAGQILGWRSFIPTFSSAQIDIAPTSRAPSDAFFTDEKIWVTLAKADTDHVYWVFDESADVVSGGMQLQHTFSFDGNAPIGAETKRRIDAFYKDGDDYRHVATRITVRNIQIKASATFGPAGLEFTLPTVLPGNWELDTVQLTRLSAGQYHDISIAPESSTATANETRVVWNGAEVATKFGYASLEEAGLKLESDKTAWISAEYKEQSEGGTLTVVKALDTRGEL